MVKHLIFSIFFIIIIIFNYYLFFYLFIKAHLKEMFFEGEIVTM